MKKTAAFIIAISVSLLAGCQQDALTNYMGAMGMANTSNVCNQSFFNSITVSCN